MRHSAVLARLNYLALDRPDIQQAVAEIAKRMPAPCAPEFRLLKGLGRYLRGAPRAVQLFMWQDDPEELVAYVHPVWAGERATRESTSGGMACRGRRLTKSWSSSQQTVALSSGEAELYALTKGRRRPLALHPWPGIWGRARGRRCVVTALLHSQYPKGWA